MKKESSIVFCFLEPSGYLMSCLRTFSEMYHYHVHLIHKPLKSEAPFVLKTNSYIHLYDENQYDKETLISLIEGFSPELLFVGGWNITKYLNAASFFHNKGVPTVLGFDNKWKGNLKQWLAIPYGKFYLSKIFDYAFVAGQAQKKMALKLGFKNERIKTGIYSADLSVFNELYQKNKLGTSNSFYFLFVGRYLRLKGIYELWEAFIELQDELNNDWELICIGTGDEFENRTIHPKIKHLGFVQPNDFNNVIRPNGIFVMPSHVEPWGVVVHEMAASGMPLVLSSEVGAKEDFLVEGVNGFEIEAKSKDSIKKALLRFMEMSSDEIRTMGDESHKLSKRNSPEKWSETLMEFVYQKSNIRQE